MKKCFVFVLLGLNIFLFVGLQNVNVSLDNLSVYQVLRKLGGKESDHFIQGNKEMVRQGKELVEKGRSVLKNGSWSKPISKYFLCTDCHNSVKEDPKITFPNPDSRLPYTITNNIPFLQGSTFWGIVNRESWYNGDYYLKYGDPVKAANHDLRKAIQLCAVECAQGRKLEKWEENAILAYFWDLELNMSDLDLPEDFKESIVQTIDKGNSNLELVDKLKTLYSTVSPATFGKPLKNKKRGYEIKGEWTTGKMIYENSCQHCHRENGASDFLLDTTRLTFRFLARNMFKENDFSIYQIIRKGTYASPGARPYMPHYPVEKMSDGQIESLRLYILKMAAE